jgi:hypothetical protein
VLSCTGHFQEEQKVRENPLEDFKFEELRRDSILRTKQKPRM